MPPAFMPKTNPSLISDANSDGPWLNTAARIKSPFSIPYGLMCKVKEKNYIARRLFAAVSPDVHSVVSIDTKILRRGDSGTNFQEWHWGHQVR